jgi:hypothetical protein
MSIGFMLTDPNEAVVWRGPRKNGLIKQFLKDVDWGTLDYLARLARWSGRACVTVKRSDALQRRLLMLHLAHPTSTSPSRSTCATAASMAQS